MHFCASASTSDMQLPCLRVHASLLVLNILFSDARCWLEQVPALSIFEGSYKRGKFDKSRQLSNGSMLEFTHIYPMDAVFDKASDVPEDVSTAPRSRPPPSPSPFSHFLIMMLHPMHAMTFPSCVLPACMKHVDCTSPYNVIAFLSIIAFCIFWKVHGLQIKHQDYQLLGKWLLTQTILQLPGLWQTGLKSLSDRSRVAAVHRQCCIWLCFGRIMLG